MPYFIASECIDVMDRSCIEECPVDCIYEGSRKLYIHPEECIDCGACEPVCPVEAIGLAARVDEDRAVFVQDNAAFFALPLDDQGEPLGLPGGAAAVSPVGSDTPLVRSWEGG